MFLEVVSKTSFFYSICSSAHLTSLKAIYKGTVNDPTTFPPPSRTHGSHHWAFERLLSAALVPLTAAAFVTSGTAYPVLDGLLGMSLVVHSHIGVSLVHIALYDFIRVASRILTLRSGAAPRQSKVPNFDLIILVAQSTNLGVYSLMQPWWTTSTSANSPSLDRCFPGLCVPLLSLCLWACTNSTQMTSVRTVCFFHIVGYRSRFIRPHRVDCKGMGSVDIGYIDPDNRQTTSGDEEVSKYQYHFVARRQCIHISTSHGCAVPRTSSPTKH